MKSSAADIQYWSWFLVDLDPLGPNGVDWEEPVEWVRAFVRNYFGAVRLHYYEVDSGRGRQLWFPLEPLILHGERKVLTGPRPRDWEPGDPDDHVFLSWRAVVSIAQSYWLEFMAKRFEQTFSGITLDTSVSDLPRVMRLPYTLNNKTGRRARFVEMNPGVNAGLAHRIVEGVPYNVWDRPAPPKAMPGVSWVKLLDYMTRAARVYLTEGATEGGRHKQAAATLLSLKELGASAETAEAALLHGAALCAPPLPPREIRSMVSRHYGR